MQRLTLMKKLSIVFLILFSAGQLWGASTGLIVVLSSLSTTALTAMETFTDNALGQSSTFEQMKAFIQENDMLLAADIARADGNTLDAVATIAGVPEPKRKDFFLQMQQHYSEIYPDETADPAYRAQAILALSRKL